MKRFSAILAFLLALVAPSALGVDINGQLRKAQLEQQSSDPTAATARVYFNTLTNTAKIYNGTAWTSLGSGAGSGEKNYVSNGSSSAVGWTASSGNITCATTTSSMPDPSLGTALAVTGVSGSTDFCYTNFTLDDADFSKKLKLAWDQYAVSNTSADFRVDVCACAVAWSGGACSAGTVAQGCGTNSTRLPLSTDSSSASLLPALTGTYRTTYDAIGTSKKYMQVQVGLAQTNTHQVNLANIVTGPGVVTQGAAVTQWQSYTPVITGTTTNPTYAAGSTLGSYRRVGESLEVEVFISPSGATNGSGEYLISIPSGYTINYTALGTTANSSVGTATGSSGVTGVGTAFTLQSAGYTDKLRVMLNTGAANKTFGSTDFVFTSGFGLSVRAVVPVNELAGSGTVNVAYTSPPSSQVRADTGNGMGSTNTKIRRFTNATTIGSGIVYADSATLGASFTITEAGIYSIAYSDRNSTTATLGISLNTTTPTTQIAAIATAERLVQADQQATASSTSCAVTVRLAAGDVIRPHDSGAFDNASAIVQFVITKVASDASQAVGFSVVQPGVSSGLVSASGVPGFTDGSADVAGYMGEYVAPTGCTTDTTQSTPTSGVMYDMTSCTLVLQPGKYLIFYTANVQTGTESLSSTSYTFPTLQIRDSGNTVYGKTAIGGYTGRANSFSNLTTHARVNISSATTFKPSFGFTQLSTGSTLSYVEINASSGHANFYAIRIH